MSLKYAYYGDETELALINRDDEVLSSRDYSARAYLCELRDDEMTYLSCDEDDGCSLMKADVWDGDGETIAVLGKGVACPRASPDGERYAYAKERQQKDLMRIYEDGESRLAKGTE